MTDLDAVLKTIAERRPMLIDLGLERTFAALERLGDPQKSLPPVIHVAGTNGKGSTIAYLKAILEAAGKSVHVYSSPHLVRFNERIVLAGKEITDDALADVLQRCDQAVDEQTLTYFETITCAAFLAFSETPADYLLLEVGLGGRLDTTNVIERPLATVVTPIALDHQDKLGAEIEQIATEKAGIFRKGVLAVIAPQTPEAMTTLEQCAAKVGAKLFAYGQDWNAYVEQGHLIYQDNDSLSDLAPPRLLGAHQINNAGLAIAAIKAAGILIDDETISKGLKEAVWPARLQRLVAGPLVEKLADGAGPDSELWLDGGHNPHAARAVAAAFSGLEERSSAELILIVGMQGAKDMTGYFAAFESLAAAVLTVSADHNGAAPAEDVAEAAKAAGIPARPCQSLKEAMAAAIDDGRGPIRILICGSLYLAGEVLKEHS